MSGELLPLEAAVERIVALAAGPLPAEVVAVDAALGRVLAEPVRAAVDLPPFDNGAMDGYAIRAADIAAATEGAPVRLAVVGESRAGSAASARVEPGSALRIATGAPLPEGADAVVQVELTTPLDATGRPGPRGRDAVGPLPAACLVHEPVAPGSSVRRRGEDVRSGSELLPAGDLLDAARIALVAGAGVGSVAVRRRPVVAVLATGDEVRPAGTPLSAGQLPDANGPGLRSLVAEAGALPLDLGIAEDRLEVVVERLRAGIAAADVVVVSGGVSVGPYDVVKPAFETVGRVDLWRVAIQPGKPFTCGEATAPDGRRVVLVGLPGNPVSSFVTFGLFVAPLLRALAGRSRDAVLDGGGPQDAAVLEESVRTSAGRRAFVRVVALRDAAGMVLRDASGRVRVRPAGGQRGQGSHVLSALAEAEALAIVPEALAEVPAGTPVGLRWLGRAWD